MSRRGTPATPRRPTAASEIRKDSRSEEHTSELQSPCNLVCRLLLEKKKKTLIIYFRQYKTTEPSRQVNLLLEFFWSSRTTTTALGHTYIFPPPLIHTQRFLQHETQ